MAGTTDDERPAEPSSSATASADDDAPKATYGEPASGRKRRRRVSGWVETLVLVAVAIVLALVVKTFLAQAFYIPSQSMEPGLEVGDRIVVQKVSYWFGGSPDRGDVVVFEDPGDWLTDDDSEPEGFLSRGLEKIGLYPSGGHLVKRVIGLPGDVVRCCDREGRLMVNGEPLDEDGFIEPQDRCDGPMVNGCRRDWSVGPIPEGRLFVMGDNRADSEDSSARLCVGRQPDCDPDDAYVPIDLVVGKVLGVVWPLSRFAFEEHPDVFDAVPDDPPSR